MAEEERVCLIDGLKGIGLLKVINNESPGTKRVLEEISVVPLAKLRLRCLIFGQTSVGNNCSAYSLSDQAAYNASTV